MQDNMEDNMEDGNEDALDILEPKQVQAATLLAAGHSIDEVCTTLSVGRTTLYLWRKDPRFAAYMNQLLRTHADQALCQSTQLLSLSFARIRAALEDANTAPAQQLRIAFRLLSLYSRPSFIRFLQGLPDDPLEIAEQDFYRANRAIGLPQSGQMDGSDFDLRMSEHYRALKAAKEFDDRYPNTQVTLSVIRASDISERPLPQLTTSPKQPTPPKEHAA